MPLPLPSTNVALIQQLYAAFAQRDVASIFSALAEDVEVVQSTDLPWGGVYRGPQGFLEFFGKLTRHISPTLAIERYIDAGEDIVAMGRTQGVTVNGGKPFDVPVAHVWRIRDAKVHRFQPYIDIPLMLQAL